MNGLGDVTVPLGAVTTILAGPAARAGVVIVIAVLAIDVGVTAIPPMVTVANSRLSPLMVTLVPPGVGPL